MAKKKLTKSQQYVIDELKKGRKLYSFHYTSGFDWSPFRFERAALVAEARIYRSTIYSLEKLGLIKRLDNGKWDEIVYVLTEKGMQ